MAKTKALISFAVTAKLICAFVFAYADCWFSHEAAQIRRLADRTNPFYASSCKLEIAVSQPSWSKTRKYNYLYSLQGACRIAGLSCKGLWI